MEQKKGSFSTVDEYIASFPEITQQLLQQIRDTIKTAAPKASEQMGYGMPMYKLNGNLVYFAGWKNHIGFYPAAENMGPFEDEIAHYKGEKASMRFPLDEPMPSDLISRIVQHRVVENLARQATIPRKKKT